MSIYTMYQRDKCKNTNRQPSVFVKPIKITDELADFLDKPRGIEIARTQVTRDINNYIRAHNLQDSVNGRHINPDEKLAALLKIPAGESLTYFNIQKYMSPHFHKNAKQIKPQPERMEELEYEIKEMRKEMKQININVEELLKRKLSAVDYFNRKNNKEDAHDIAASGDIESVTNI